MIYGLFIFDKCGRNSFKRFYGKLNLDQELLLKFVREFITFIQNLDQSNRTECLNLENMKLVYSLFEDIILVFCADQKEDEMYLMDKLIRVQEEFIKLFKNLPKEKVEGVTEQEEVEGDVEPKIEEKPFKDFEKIVDEIIFPFLKIAILGSGGVGKTSVLKLIMGEKPDSAYIPTVGVDLKEFDIEVKNMRLVFWDFSGQPRFRKLWQPFLEGTDIVILVTDSTAQSLTETKAILQLIKAEKADAKVILIANKQDLPNASPPEEIEKKLGTSVNGLVAIDPNYREKMLEILKKTILEIIESKSKQPRLPEIST
nr:ADP-ribosylation factor-like protein [Candidatus Freyarchaeota archaeon]